MKKVVLSLIAIILLCGIGYFVYSKINKDKPNEVIQSPTYNEVKKVNIDGEDYIVGLKKYGKNYQFDKIPAEGTGAIELYLNNEKIKTITYKVDSVDPGDVKINIEPYKFSKNYILVSITYSDGIKICYKDFYVFNLKGEFIGDATWDGKYGIKELSTGKTLTYEINDDNLIIYNANTLTKVRYSIKDNELVKETIKTYNENEIELISK